MNKQTGSVLAILIGVGLLFAAATNRVGAAISALRGSSTPPPNAGDDAPTTDDATTETGTGVTKSLASNGTTRFTQTGTVR